MINTKGGSNKILYKVIKEKPKSKILQNKLKVIINQAIAVCESIQFLAAGSSYRRDFVISTHFCISSLRTVFNMFYNWRTTITMEIKLQLSLFAI